MKGQSAMEYLIMIIAVLAVAAVVVLFMSGAFGVQKGSASFASCKEAASRCAMSKISAPDDPCTQCESACIDASGKDIISSFTGCGDACSYCKLGMMDELYPRNASNISIQCGVDTDCADFSTQCQVRHCVDSRCTYTLNTQCGPSDGCCPAGCSATIDDDCAAVCGNNVKEGAEVCDGSVPVGTTCVTLGFSGGTLTCSASCTFDTSQCFTGCNLAAECDDTNACTTDTCTNHACFNTAVADGTTCPGGTCTGGLCSSYECTTNADCAAPTPDCNTATHVCVECLTAAECSDSNECTIDACTSNACVNTLAADGTACNTGKGECQIGTCHTPSLSLKSQTALVSNPKTVAVSGDYAYIGGTSGNLLIYNTTNKATPASLPSLPLNPSVTAVNDIKIFSNYMYLATTTGTTGTIYAYDITNPSAPSEIASGAITTATPIMDLEINVDSVDGKTYLYFTNGTIGIYEITDVNTPALRYTGVVGAMTTIKDIEISGSYLYALNSTATLTRIVSVSTATKTAPALTNSLQLDTGMDNNFEINGNYAYVGGVDTNSKGLSIVSIATPATLTITKQMSTTTLNSTGLSVYGKYVYLSGLAGTTYITKVYSAVDLANPAFVESKTPSPKADNTIVSGYLYAVGENAAGIYGMNIYQII